MIEKLIRTSIISFIVIILAMIGYTIYLQLDSVGKHKVTIAIAPAKAKLEIDGKTTTGKEVLLTPGKHTYRVSYDGFEPESGEIDVRTDGKKAPLIVGLAPNTATGRKLYEELKGDYLIMEGVAGEAAQENGAAFASKNPIVRQLPYPGMLFTIGYRADPADPTGDSIILEIDAPAVYRTEAVTQITNWGYNPVDYKINFINESNPFV